MSDIKLFRLSGQAVTELAGASVTVEKSLQNLIEKNLDTFLGIRFLASEYSTGKTHGGRLDTLGLDENSSPVIVEYKRAVNENVINQGLYYLDWLLDHRAEFELLVMKRFGKGMSDAIDWSAPRLLCIAGDFKKYDEHAVRQINRNIELIRYKQFGDELLMLDLVNATMAENSQVSVETGKPLPKPQVSKTIEEQLLAASTEVKDRFESLRAYALALRDDVQLKTLKYYFAFTRLRNFMCAEVHPQKGWITVSLKVNPDTITLEQGFTRHVRKIGHYGTGDLEVIVRSNDDIERVKPLILHSYEVA